MTDEPGKFRLPYRERTEDLKRRKENIARARFRPKTVYRDGQRYTLIRLPDAYGDTT